MPVLCPRLCLEFAIHATGAVSSTLDALKSGHPVVLLIQGDGGLMYLTIELE